jgi:general secretion pathway protein K
MKTSVDSSRRGFALIIVMIVITFLAILAGGFAYSMKVETKLARNTSFEPDLEWIGRSGVEFARYLLVQQLVLSNEPWESLNQKWAGGPGGTNELLASLSLDNNPVGAGSFSIKIIDLERKFNINAIADPNSFILQQALNVAGVDQGQSSVAIDSFLDWTDPNEDRHLSGTESADYIANPNPGFSPYVAKNGPIDDLGELLLIRGITPDVFFGGAPSQGPRPLPQSMFLRAWALRSGAGNPSGGLVNLFTTLSSGAVNINTASSQVLELIPAIDPAMAQSIVTARAGLDGTDGTEDDTPFRAVGELMRVPGIPPPLIQQLQLLCGTRSISFEIHIEAQINQYKRYFVAVLRRNLGNPRDVQTLYFHWK